jgi:hypothetical protein
MENIKFMEDNLRGLLRGRLARALEKYLLKKKSIGKDEYGIDYNQIMKKLEPFPSDFGKYQIDHIKPLSAFNLIKEDGSVNLSEINIAFAPENHQWLLIKDNLKKGAKHFIGKRLYNGKEKAGRVRKTVSFKFKAFNEIERLRGGKTFSTFLNNFLEEKLLNEKIERRTKKKNEK